MIDLIVVRHGETDWNRIRRLQGQTDIALNGTGVDQAVRLAKALATAPIAAIYSSDLARAMATAQPVAAGLGLAVVTRRELRERHYGLLEGLTYAEIEARHPEEAARMKGGDATTPFPNGESQQTFFDRSVAAVTRIAEDAMQIAAAGDARSVLIVTHGGVLDMLYRAANALSLADERRCPIPNAVINRLRYEAGRLTVQAWAEVPATA